MTALELTTERIKELNNLGGGWPNYFCFGDFIWVLELIHGGPMQNAFKETIGGVFPTNIIWWDSAAKQTKFFEKIVDRSNEVFPPRVTCVVYGVDGAIVVTLTDDIVYADAVETSRTRTVVVT